MDDQQVLALLGALRQDVEQLRRDLLATRAWCNGLEEEQAWLLGQLDHAREGRNTPQPSS